MQPIAPSVLSRVPSLLELDSFALPKSCSLISAAHIPPAQPVETAVLLSSLSCLKAGGCLGLGRLPSGGPRLCLQSTEPQLSLLAF